MGDTLDVKRVTLEHLDLSGIPSSDSSPQGSGSSGKRKKDTKSQRGQRTPKKQCLPDTTGRIHTRTDRLWLHTEGPHGTKPVRVPALRWKIGHCLAPLTKKLSPTGNCF